MRKLKTPLLKLLVVLAIAFGVAQLVHNGPPRFWHDFSGMTEADVRARLGAPFRDSRKHRDGTARHYTLAGRQGFERALVLEFQDGVVVSQNRHSRWLTGASIPSLLIPLFHRP